ncbi:MAG: TIGR00268 family protein [Spirochaetes bacterium RBG_16_49_21]|nr:MAG: TIGR00268 family protein [Spirochaetes bacterium RBG_16_49_21]
MAKTKLIELKKIIKTYGRTVVAYSGGSDSTFLLKICADVLGTERVIAATGSSETYTPGELSFARRIARDLRVRHVIIETDELHDELFSSNTKLRCYHCKSNFYSKLASFARSEHIDFVLDGTNIDDKKDYRPGMKAAREWGVKSPLAQAGMTKGDIRRYSKKMGLISWDKPASPCLASRIPYGSRITKEKLSMIAEAEEFIRGMGFKTIRVRHHDSTARIEIPLRDLPRIIRKDMREKIGDRLKRIGFCWVSLDIEGFKSGSLNRALDRG